MRTTSLAIRAPQHAALTPRALRSPSLLGDATAVLLALAAGRPVRWDHLVSAVGRTEDAISQAIDTLLARGAVRFVRERSPALVSVELTSLGRSELARALVVMRRPATPTAGA